MLANLSGRKTEMHGARPTFTDVFRRLDAHGPAQVVSSRGTEYRVTAEVRRGVEVIIGRPGSGQVRIHADCWGNALTCQRTRAGGIYNGNPSIFDWYRSDLAPPPSAPRVAHIPDRAWARPTTRRVSRPETSQLVDEFRRIGADHRSAILKFTARSALPPSVTRVFKAGTKDALVPLLGRLPMDELVGVPDEPAFRRWFEHQLEQVAAVILERNSLRTRPGIHPGYKWGHGTKVLALLVRDVVLRSRYFSDVEVTRIEPWLCCPIDGIVIGRLTTVGARPAVSQIRGIDSAGVFWALQDRLGSAAAEAGVPRVWFDDVWGDRDL